MLMLQSIAIPFTILTSKENSFKKTSLKFTMSDKCGNCDCADQTQCVKKGNTMVIETEKSYISTVVTEFPVENDCKCGANCTCTSCGCGH